MSISEWSESHAVHIPAVDDEHRHIFRLCADLQRAMTAAAPSAEIQTEIQTIVEDLVIHTAQHLSHEEREMRAARYPLYEWHRHQHQAARARVKAFNRRVRRGDSDAAGELIRYLSGWLNDHIRLADRMLGAYLRNHQRELSCSR